MARPTVMTDEVIAKLEEAFAWGCTDVEACLWADIATKTLYNYQEKNPEFVQRKEELKETPVMLARKSVVSTLSSDPRLSMDFLSRKKKDEFSQRVDSDITSGGDKIDAGISTKQIEQLIRARATRESSDI